MKYIEQCTVCVCDKCGDKERYDTSCLGENEDIVCDETLILFGWYIKEGIHLCENCMGKDNES